MMNSFSSCENMWKAVSGLEGFFRLVGGMPMGRDSATLTFLAECGAIESSFIVVNDLLLFWPLHEAIVSMNQLLDRILWSKLNYETVWETNEDL
jgi:hypothetical protein